MSSEKAIFFYMPRRLTVHPFTGQNQNWGALLPAIGRVVLHPRCHPCFGHHNLLSLFNLSSKCSAVSLNSHVSWFSRYFSLTGQSIPFRLLAFLTQSLQSTSISNVLSRDRFKICLRAKIHC